MEFEIKFKDGDGIADLEIALSGISTPASLVKLNEALTGDARFRTGMTMIADLTTLNTHDLTDVGLQGLSNTVVERDWHHMPSAVAIIAPGERTYNAALSYRAHLGGSRSHREVFRSRAEAVAWLEAQHRSD